MNEENKSKFRITNVLVVIFLLYSILPASTGITYLLIVLLIDVIESPKSIHLHLMH